MPDPGEPTDLPPGWYDADPSGRVVHIPTADAAGVIVEIPANLTEDAHYTCTGCGHTRQLPHTWELLAAAGSHAAQCGRGTTNAALEHALVDVRAELIRADSKAATMLGLAGVLLGGGLAILAGAHLPAAAAAAGWVTAALVAAAVVVLAAAVRPDLAGNFGFMRYARHEFAEVLLGEFSGNDTYETLHDRAYHLRWLSIAARTKYTRIRHAITLLVLGLAAAAVTAALTAPITR